jgi:hypothetical protein
MNFPLNVLMMRLADAFVASRRLIGSLLEHC